MEEDNKSTLIRVPSEGGEKKEGDEPMLTPGPNPELSDKKTTEIVSQGGGRSRPLRIIFGWAVKGHLPSATTRAHPCSLRKTASFSSASSCRSSA
jgi:hypothetical protein